MKNMIFTFAVLSICLINVAHAKDVTTEKISGGLTITTTLEEQKITNGYGRDLELVLTVDLRGRLDPGGNEAIMNVTQGIYCTAYRVCEKAGAFLAGGSANADKRESCELQDYQNVEMEPVQSGFLGASGILHFTCVKPSGESVIGHNL